MQLKNKKLIIIIVLAIIGVLLIIVGGKKQSANTGQENNADIKAYTKELEKKIEDFLLSIEGINKVKVIITLELTNEQNEQYQNSSNYLSFKSNNEASKASLPTVRGIAIACTNGENDEVKIKITKLITAYLGISSNRIEIVGIK